MIETICDKELVSASQDNPISLLEIYYDVVIEHGIQFDLGYSGGLLMRSIPHKSLTYSRLTPCGVCIYAMQPSDCRLFIPSPNVRLPPLTMHNLYDQYHFKTMQEALRHPQITSELSEVSLDIYIELWRAAGANIGRKVNGFICWEKAFLRNFKTQCLH